MSGKVIGYSQLKQDVQTPLGLVPENTLVIECYRHGVNDMFTRVRCMVEGKELVFSGLSLTPPSFEIPGQWWFFPPEAFVDVEKGDEERDARPECLEHLALLGSLSPDA
jgi:hypothetical protein